MSIKVTYNAELERFELNSTYQEYKLLLEKLGIKSLAQTGWKFNPKNKTWSTKSKNSAALVDPKIKKVKKNNEVTEKFKPSDIVSGVEGMDLYPYQKEGVAALLNRGSALLADEMGLGKTVQALMCMRYSNSKKILVICPKSLVSNWKRESEKWTNYNVNILSKGKEVQDGINIINYASCFRDGIAKNILKQEWSFLCLDESHAVKNRKAKRTKFIKKIKAKKILAMTGTPIRKDPSDIFTTLEMIDPDDLGSSFFSFAKKYSSGEAPWGGYFWNDLKKLDNLNADLQKKMVRRLKKNVLKDLPDKIRTVIHIEANTKTKRILNETEKLRDLFRDKKAVERVASEEYLDDFEKVENDILAQLTKLRREVGINKVKPAFDFILNTLDSSENPIIIWCYHHTVSEKLKKALKEKGYDSEIINSKFNDKDEKVQRFLNKENRILLAGIGTVSEGLTLLPQGEVPIQIFLEIDWVPAKLNQAENRCHRIGTKESPNIYYLIWKDSFEGNIIKTLNKKNMFEEAVVSSGDIVELESEK